MFVDRLVGALDGRISRASHGAPGRGSSGSSASTIPRGGAVLAGEGDGAVALPDPSQLLGNSQRLNGYNQLEEECGK